MVATAAGTIVRDRSGVLTTALVTLLLVFSLAVCATAAPAPPPKPPKYSIGFRWQAGVNQLRLYKIVGQEMYFEVWLEYSRGWEPFIIMTPAQLRKALDYEKEHLSR